MGEIAHLFLEYTNFKDNLIEYKCLCFNKNYKNKFDQHLKKQFFNTWKFSNLDINTLLLPNVFENFQTMCHEIYELHPARFLIASGLAWQTNSKKTKEKLGFSIDIDMLLMVEKRYYRVICHAIYQHAETNKKYMKEFDINKELHILNIGM